MERQYVYATRKNVSRPRRQFFLNTEVEDELWHLAQEENSNGELILQPLIDEARRDLNRMIEENSINDVILGKKIKA